MNWGSETVGCHFKGEPSKEDGILLTKDPCVLLSTWRGVSGQVREGTAQPHRRQGIWTAEESQRWAEGKEMGQWAGAG